MIPCVADLQGDRDRQTADHSSEAQLRSDAVRSCMRRRMRRWGRERESRDVWWREKVGYVDEQLARGEREKGKGSGTTLFGNASGRPLPVHHLSPPSPSVPATVPIPLDSIPLSDSS